MMFLQQLVKAITSGWKWIVIGVLIAVSISLAISATTVPIFRSEATFIIAPNKNLPSSRDVVSAFTALDTLNIFSTYSDILGSERVLEEAYKNLEISDSELEQYKRSTAMKPESLILELTVDGPDAQVASIIANEIGNYGIQFINAYFSVFEIDFLDQATPPEQTFRPRIFRDMGIAAGIGLIVGLLVVLIKEFMEISLNQFIQKFSIDNESMAFTKRSIEKTLVKMKASDNEWPITFFLIYIKNLQEFLSIAPGFSKKRVTSEIVKRFRDQLKGNDLIGRWDDTTFSVVLPRTPKKTSKIINNRLSNVFTSPFVYGVEETEQISLEPILVSTTAEEEDEFETFIEDAETELKDLEW